MRLLGIVLQTEGVYRFELVNSHILLHGLLAKIRNAGYNFAVMAPRYKNIRCQTAPSLWTLGSDQPVIPGVAFIR